MGNMEVGEAGTFLSEAIEVGGGVALRAEAADVSITLIVRENDYHVGRWFDGVQHVSTEEGNGEEGQKSDNACESKREGHGVSSVVEMRQRGMLFRIAGERGGGES